MLHLEYIIPRIYVGVWSHRKTFEGFHFPREWRRNEKYHDAFDLKKKLKRLKDYALDKYDDQLKKLYDHYQSRYHNNETMGKGASGAELPEIDA